MVKPSRIYYSALLMVACCIAFVSLNPALSLSHLPGPHNKIPGVPHIPDLPPCDLKSATTSPEAIELANHLGLAPMFQQLEILQQQVQTDKNSKAPLEIREELRDVKENILEKIEQTRLEIDFTQAELAVDIAVQNELLRAYTEARDNKVDEVNKWSFRTNGVLWAVAEGLDIPTYRRPRYSIPSGTIGILAGLVPSVFSLVAVGDLKGGHYGDTTRPNMLCKIFDYPTTPQIEYPDSVLAYLRSVPTNHPGWIPRIDYMISRWAQDENIHSFTDKDSRMQVNAITGYAPSKVTIAVVSDRLTMLQQLSAAIYQMNRPLLELMMVVRGLKHFN